MNACGSVGIGRSRDVLVRVLALLLAIPIALCHPGLHRASTAEAHPGTAQLGQRAELALHTAGPGLSVALTYVAEIPAIRVYSEARTANDPAYAEHLRTALASAIALTWEGEKVPLTVSAAADTPGGAIVEAPGDMLELHVYATGELSGSTGTLKLLNRNFPDEGGYFATSVQVGGDLVVTATTLTQVREGHVYKNHHGAWLRDESAREPTVTVRPAAWWERRPGDAPLPERLEGLDTLKPPVGAIAGAAALVLGGGVGIGVWVRRRRPRRTTSS